MRISMSIETFVWTTVTVAAPPLAERLKALLAKE